MSVDVSEKDGLIIVTLAIAAAAVGSSLAKHVVKTRDEFDKAAELNKVDAMLLRAIQQVENPRNIKTPVKNTNGTADYGIMQINERTFKSYNVPSELWLDDITGINIAARYMNDTRKELGVKYDLLNWIASYNLGTPNVKKYGITNPRYVGSVFYHYLMYRAANA